MLDFLPRMLRILQDYQPQCNSEIAFQNKRFETWTTDTRWLKLQYQFQTNVMDLDIKVYFFVKMENTDKGLTVPKEVLINFSKIPKMPQNLHAKFSAQVQKFGALMKKGFIGCPESAL